jgi:hypothetical protein
MSEAAERDGRAATAAALIVASQNSFRGPLMDSRSSRAAFCLLILCAALGCGNGGRISGQQPKHEPKIGLRSDVFQGVPAWESDLFAPRVGRSETVPVAAAATVAAQRTSAETSGLQARVRSLSKISSLTSPGLYVLLRQAEPNSPLLASAEDERVLADELRSLSAMVAGTALTAEDARDAANLRLYGTTQPSSVQPFDIDRLRQRTDSFVRSNQNPLPARLAKEPLANAFVLSMATAHYNGNLKVLAKAASVAPPSPYKLPERTFTVQDFRSCGEQFLRANLDVVQGTAQGAGVDERTARVTQMSSAGASGLPPWDGLAFQYFVAYYRGEFVTRAGGKLAKPELGKKISNETLSSAVTVGLESIYDFAVLAASKGPAEHAIKAPIVFRLVEKKEQFLTAGNNKPTLVVVTQKLLKKKKGDPTEEWPFVVEKLAANDKRGLSQAKVKVIQWCSGVAGDAAGSLSDLITRTFGGINVGFIVLGKVSVGDNDTLAKLVATTVESIAHRSSELFVSHVLYDVTFDKPEPAEGDPLAVLLLKYVVKFDGDNDEE